MFHQSLHLRTHGRGMNELRRLCLIVLFAAILFTTSSCEVDSKLSITGGNTPSFVMTGNGRLTSLRLRGPDKQREADGEDAFLYWVIESQDGSDRVVSDVSPIIYGRVPEGYRQVYPEKGLPPQLVEGDRYYAQVVTMNANGDGKYFTIRQGKVELEP